MEIELEEGNDDSDELSEVGEDGEAIISTLDVHNQIWRDNGEVTTDM